MAQAVKKVIAKPTVESLTKKLETIKDRKSKEARLIRRAIRSLNKKKVTKAAVVKPVAKVAKASKAPVTKAAPVETKE